MITHLALYSAVERIDETKLKETFRCFRYAHGCYRLGRSCISIIAIDRPSRASVRDLSKNVATRLRDRQMALAVVPFFFRVRDAYDIPVGTTHEFQVSGGFQTRTVVPSLRKITC